MEEGGQVLHLVSATVLLLLIAAGTLAVARRAGIPFTVALVIVGMGLAQLGGLHIPELEFLEPVVGLEMPPEVILFVFLPTLIFESAFKMDARALRENLAPVLTLAIPGLLISTAMIGGIMALLTPLSWPEGLLLGAILSATDPVAVISLFQQLGAPKRLTILVEGESLFNDATAIVLSRIIAGIVTASVGVSVVSTDTILYGALNFFLVFFGGLLVGWAAALVLGTIMGRVESDAFIEISLTTILAYASFLLAEETFGVSGVMATVAAGMMIGGWGKAKISPGVADYLEHFWEYLAMLANALIFLLVGLLVDLGALWNELPMLALVIVAMLLSRAAVIYGLVPVVGKLPNADPIDVRYQTVMFWGGLRGAIALAIVLSLTGFAQRELFVALVTGVVLFTLLVQGLTIERVVRYFGLHIPPLSDRLARIEGLLSAKHRTLEQVPELQTGGLFAPRIARGIRERCSEDVRELHDSLEELREEELNRNEERRLLYLRCFGEEKTLYYRMFSRGHLSERTYRNLTHSIELQTEKIRHEGRLPEFTLHPPTGERFENVLFRVLDRVVGFGGLVERLRAERTARDYEVAWARSRGSARVLADLEELGSVDSARPEVVEEVRAYYEYWQESARARMDLFAEQFPEFVLSTQERLADRLVLHAEREAIEEKAHSGIIPHGVAETMLEEMAEELRELRASQVSKLRVDPEELLRKVPFFRETPPDDFSLVAERLRRRTAPAGEVIVKQGGQGSSLYLIARGVIRVSRQDGGMTRDLATLMAGDFFGEMALLHGTPRTATCRAVTPCALYELRREDLDAVQEVSPTVREALEEADRRRRAELLESRPDEVPEEAYQREIGAPGEGSDDPPP